MDKNSFFLSCCKFRIYRIGVLVFCKLTILFCRPAFGFLIFSILLLFQLQKSFWKKFKFPDLHLFLYEVMFSKILFCTFILIQDSTFQVRLFLEINRHFCQTNDLYCKFLVVLCSFLYIGLKLEKVQKIYCNIINKYKCKL